MFNPLHLMILSMVLWSISIGILIFRDRGTLKFIAHCVYLSGVASLLVLVMMLWYFMDRPPMRTIGETRLWYSIFLPLVGYVVWLRWRYKWLLYYCAAIATVFLLLNLLNPENFDRDLMPALQSPWFVPHVVVYILGYAVLCVATILAIKNIIVYFGAKNYQGNYLLIDNLVSIGFGFLTFGLISGALWGKEAWGHYWNWDPKEVWALITWMGYLVYIHYRRHRPKRGMVAACVLAVSFGFLLMCWFGVNYLPSATSSLHVYTR